MPFATINQPAVGMVSRRTLMRRACVAVGIAATALPDLAIAGPEQHLFATASPGSTLVVDHSSWDGLLKNYVKPAHDGINRVDYTAFKSAGHSALKQYLQGLQSLDPRTLDRPEQMALLINVYNARTLDILLDHYPIASIKEISLGGGLLALVTGGPWKAKVLKLKGVDFSLDDIEHGVLRPLIKDNRIHYTVNCASIGCPNLNVDAFTGATLTALLDLGAKTYINSRRDFSVRDSQVTASSIYNWFKEDFGANDRGILDHARKYAAPALASALHDVTSISDYAYDWGLNDISR